MCILYIMYNDTVTIMYNNERCDMNSKHKLIFQVGAAVYDWGEPEQAPH